MASTPISLALTLVHALAATPASTANIARGRPYTFSKPPNYHISRERTPRNRAAAVRDMQAHFVNVPVSMKMPWPKPGAFDAHEMRSDQLP